MTLTELTLKRVARVCQHQLSFLLLVLILLCRCYWSTLMHMNLATACQITQMERVGCTVGPAQLHWGFPKIWLVHNAIVLVYLMWRARLDIPLVLSVVCLGI